MNKEPTPQGDVNYRPRRKRKKPWTIECRATVDIIDDRLQWMLKWKFWDRYAKEQDRDKALVDLSGKESVFEYRKGE